MKFSVKLFNFYGTPVHLKLWFLLLFFWLNPVYILAIFISILLHELGHAFMAHRLGYKVHNIYVDIFNGAAIIDLDKMDNKEQLKVVAAGPWVNMMLLSLSVFISAFFKNHFIWSMCVVNFLLLVFNILPIFPLDGGRLLRTYLKIKTNDENKSIRISSWVSLLFSSALFVFYLTNFSLIMVVFSLIFILYALKDLGYIKFPVQ